MSKFSFHRLDSLEVMDNIGTISIGDLKVMLEEYEGLRARDLRIVESGKLLTDRDVIAGKFILIDIYVIPTDYICSSANNDIACL